MYWANPFGYIALLSSAVNFVVAYLMLRLRPGHPANRWGFLAYATFGAWTLMEAVERFYPLYTKPPVLLGRLLILPEPFVVAFLLLFAITFPAAPRRRDITVLTHVLVFFAFVWSIVITSTPYIVSDMYVYEVAGIPTWGVVWGHPVALAFFFSYISLVAGAAIYVMGRKYMGGTGVESELISPILWGVVISFSLVAVTGILPPFLGIEMYPLSSPATAVLAVFTLVALRRFSRLVPIPRREGTVEIFEESRGEFIVAPKDKARALFLKMVSSGREALAMTSFEPSVFREETGLKTVPVMKFDTRVGKDVLDLRNPYHVDMIHYISYSYLSEAERGVVFVEGLNLHRDLIDYEALLGRLREVSYVTGGAVIVSEVSP
jgi:hypothetical protein